MILWLSSYPRSGNTFLRSMFRQAFGLYSYSIYNDMNDIGGNEDVRHEVGHLFINGSIQEFYEESMRSAEIVPVKTHDPPIDQAPAVYVVRDGRAALVSYWYFLRKVRRRHELTLGEVIRGGATKFGSWSEHVTRWSPLSRPNTLLLRYEDLVGDSETAIAKIAGFTGRKPVGKWQDNFQRMQTAFPAFFNTASNAKNIDQMNADDLALFW
ncbi:MAG: sulfotransferase domain-containing protein, partial [Thermomicrobiales bacterium]